MCGIVGMISKNQNGFFSGYGSAFSDLLHVDALRGPDSTGMFLVTNQNKISIMKQSAPPYIFKRAKTYDDVENAAEKDGIFWVGHNRKATQGEINSDNAHPFRSGPIIMVHNGNFPKYEEHFKTEVDSEALCKYLEKNRDKPDFGLNDISGAFAIVWYDKDKRKLFFFRNTDRPLYMGETSSSFVFASESDFIKVAIERNRLMLVEPPKSVTTGIIYSVSLEDPSKIDTYYTAPVKEYSYNHTSNYNYSNFHANRPTYPPTVTTPSALIQTLPESKKAKTTSVCFLPIDSEDMSKSVKIHGMVWKPEDDKFKVLEAVYFMKNVKADVIDHVMNVGVLEAHGIVSEHTKIFYIQNIVQPTAYKDWNNNPITTAELDFLYQNIMCVTCDDVLQEFENITTALSGVVIKANFTGEIEQPTYHYVCKGCLNQYCQGELKDTGSLNTINEILSTV